METVETSNILGVEFWNVRRDPVLAYFKESIENDQKIQVCFVSADCVNITVRDSEYKTAIEHSDCVLPDGAGIKIGCRLTGTRLTENLNGTDLFPHICALSAKENFSIYLLGSEDGVAEHAGDYMVKDYPGLNICGFHHGYFDHENCDEIIEDINNANPDFLLVAFGVPLQDKWINKNKDRINAKVFMGVGGLFDFYSGKHRRAPLWMRKINLEWLHRLYLEPRRLWKRYILGNPLYLFRVVKWRLFGKKKN